MIAFDQLSRAISAYLPNQRWFGSNGRELQEVSIESVDVLRQQWPLLLAIRVKALLDDNTSQRYQVLMGLRQSGQTAVFLEGKVEAVMGEFSTDLGPAYGYDALRDPELALPLFEIAFPDLGVVERVRPVGTEQSNSSLVYDDRFVVKFFRRLPLGRNLDLEVTKRLQEVGFEPMAEVVGEWTAPEADLAMAQRFLVGGTEGWQLALTSLRDLLGRGGEPFEAGGDFAGEAERLGEMTAKLHGALAEAFGVTAGSADAWADSMQDQLRTLGHPEVDDEAAAELFESLRTVPDIGPAIRVHGDYHLGQVMQTDKGWRVMDFEGEPARSIEDRRLKNSPLKDVAGMLRSFGYAAASVRADRDKDEVELASSWEERNRKYFLEGYVASAHEQGGLLPSDTESFDVILRAFELDKAIYEIGYEIGHRPDWLHIPLQAVRRLLA
ncbi:MAG: phosphotransferase [Actinomycetota bacterium]